MILWQLKTGVFQSEVCRPEEGLINAVLRGLDHFTREIWTAFANSSLCCALAGGKISPLSSWSQRELCGFLRSDLPEIASNSALRALDRDLESGGDLAGAHCSLKELNAGECAIDFQVNLASSTWRTLAAALPDLVPTGVFLDLRGLPADHQLRLTTGEQLEELIPLARTSLSQVSAMSWNQIDARGSLWLELEPPKRAQSAKSAICLALGLPGAGGAARRWREIARVAERLQALELAHRIIPVTRLREQWHELDLVVAAFEALGTLGRRQLEGFCAAGGTVLSVGQPMQLELEIPFDRWLADKVHSQNPPTSSD